VIVLQVVVLIVVGYELGRLVRAVVVAVSVLVDHGGGAVRLHEPVAERLGQRA
jgi:hypothetical protein